MITMNFDPFGGMAPQQPQLPSVYFKRLNDLAHIPTRGSNDAAGLDLYAATEDSIEIPSHSTVKVGTGIAVELLPGTFGAIFARSGLATKKGLAPANKVGVIDSDYRGELIVALHNDTDEVQTIEAGERIAQFVILPYVLAQWIESDELSETMRGTGGFGSTGTN